MQKTTSEKEKPVETAAAPVAKKKLSYKEQRELEQLDKDLPALEAEKATLTEKMSSPLSYEELQEVSARLIAVTNELEEKEMRWLELSEVGN